MPDKMFLHGYSDAHFSKSAGEPYEVFLNPDTIALNNKNAYDTTDPQGAVGETPRFNSASQGTLTFNLMLDGTRTIDGKAIEVADEIKKMEGLMLAYKSASGSPNFVQVVWGKIDFKGRLTTFNVSYTMFRADGAPLRAKVDLAFISADDAKAQDVKAVEDSKKKTQKRVVKAGDTLPKLCQDVYGNPGNYLQVAQKNNLRSLIRLELGKELIFPPLS